MLDAEVSNLRTPPQEQRTEGQHGGDVAYTDVRDVYTPEEQTDMSLIFGENHITVHGLVTLWTCVRGLFLRSQKTQFTISIPLPSSSSPQISRIEESFIHLS